MGFIDLERKHPGLTAKELSQEKGANLGEASIRRYRGMLAKAGVSYMEDGEDRLPALSLAMLDKPSPWTDGTEGCGGIDGQDGKTSMSDPRNTMPAKPNRPSNPEAVVNVMPHEHILSSELFGTPTIVVSPPPESNERESMDGSQPLFLDEGVYAPPEQSESEGRDERDAEGDWLSLHDDHFIALFLARNPQPVPPLIIPKKRRRSSNRGAGW